MSTGTLFGKRTWIGFGCAAGLLCVLLMLGAFLAVRCILPMTVVPVWLWISYGLAALIGGRVAATGQGRELCAFLPGMLLYMVAWLLALCSECKIDFPSVGVGITIAVMAGVVIAYLSCSKKKKRNRDGKRHKRPSMRTVRR